MKRLWQSDDAPDNAESSKRMDLNNEGRSNESMSDDPILQSNHKIFLSHSGAQKDFVEQLCEDLERSYHFPFFDKRPSSLPKSERFPELIFKAAAQCQMGIVVVSEEYFLSKWPMLELHTIVQARLKSNTKPKILPLFYKLSVWEFGNEEKREQWFDKWEEWAKNDERINVNEWKEFLKVLASFNGFEYNLVSGVGAYRKDIVSSICKEVQPDIKWNDSHVQGRLSFCQAFRCRIDQIPASQEYKVQVIGFYGIGGIGKTTICKTLGNELIQEFEGKVSHIEFGSKSYEELLREVVKDLTHTSGELLQQLNEGQCWNILQKDLYKEKTFLALDNIWDDHKAICNAKMYLQAHFQKGQFHNGSIVMVTSRSLQVLKYLGINPSHCFEMPELGHEEAKNIFLHHAAYGKQFSNNDDMNAIKQCLTLCYFRKGDNIGCHYLPLALKALGVQMGCVGSEPSHWVKALCKVKDFNYLKEKENQVFSFLRSSYDRLRPLDQNLFIDAVLYSPRYKLDLIEWLSLVYNQDLQEVESGLLRLKGKALLEDVDVTSQSISVHDLYCEFAKLEAEGKLNESAYFEKRRWVYYEDISPTELETTPSHTCWQNLTRIGILESEHHKIQSLQGIEWRYFSNVVVLKLVGLCKLRGDLNLKGLKCLRSLEMIGLDQLDSLHGLQDLNNLTYFRWIRSYDCGSTSIGQLPASLKVLYLRVLGVLLRPDAFARCTNLRNLELRGHRGGNLDLNFSNCTSLQSLWLRDCHAADNLDFSDCTSLQSVTLDDCHADNLDYSNWTSLHRFSLQNSRAGNLDFKNCTSLHSFSLQSSRAGNLNFRNCTSLHRHFWLQDCRVDNLDFSNCASLKKITLQDCRAAGNLDLSNCASLQSIGLSWVKLLKTVSGLSAVSTPSLQSFRVYCCDDLVEILGSEHLETEDVLGLGCLQQLRELKWTWTLSGSIKVPNLSGCKQLQVVDFENNRGLRSLKGVLWDLPELRHLDLRGCESLSRLPDLCRSRNLEELGLHGSGVKIREEDIFWLATLPHLRRVPGWF